MFCVLAYHESNKSQQCSDWTSVPPNKQNYWLVRRGYCTVNDSCLRKGESSARHNLHSACEPYRVLIKNTRANICICILLDWRDVTWLITDLVGKTVSMFAQMDIALYSLTVTMFQALQNSAGASCEDCKLHKIKSIEFKNVQCPLWRNGSSDTTPLLDTDVRRLSPDKFWFECSECVQKFCYSISCRPSLLVSVTFEWLCVSRRQHTKLILFERPTNAVSCFRVQPSRDRTESFIRRVQFRKTCVENVSDCFSTLKDVLADLKTQLNDDVHSGIMHHLQITVRDFFAPKVEGIQRLCNRFVLSVPEQGLRPKQSEELTDILTQTCLKDTCSFY